MHQFLEDPATILLEMMEYLLQNIASQTMAHGKDLEKEWEEISEPIFGNSKLLQAKYAKS